MVIHWRFSEVLAPFRVTGDVFISYSKADLARAKEIEKSLRSEGFSTFFAEQHNTLGEDFTRHIEHALAAAKAVLTLWSKHSVESNWVRREANYAQRTKKFAPVKIETCEWPIQFSLDHTLDLCTWETGMATHADWRHLVRELEEKGCVRRHKNTLSVRISKPRPQVSATQLSFDFGPPDSTPISEWRYFADRTRNYLKSLSERDLRQAELKARGNDRVAQHLYGCMCLFGPGAAGGITEAIVWLMRASKREHSESDYVLGLIWEFGVGCHPNREKALRHFCRAARKGHKKAKASIARALTMSTTISRTQSAKDIPLKQATNTHARRR